MKTLIQTLAVIAIAIPTVVLADITGQAKAHPHNGSGVHGTFNFLDDGIDLTVSATAHGLDPAGIYISLIYDNGSAPGGPTACDPTIFNPSDPDVILPSDIHCSMPSSANNAS